LDQLLESPPGAAEGVAEDAPLPEEKPEVEPCEPKKE
jgi:hypothetical protein